MSLPCPESSVRGDKTREMTGTHGLGTISVNRNETNNRPFCLEISGPLVKEETD